MNRVRLRYRVSTFDPRLLFTFRKTGIAAGAFAANIDDFIGRGELDVLPKIRGFPEQRFGKLK